MAFLEKKFPTDIYWIRQVRVFQIKFLQIQSSLSKYMERLKKEKIFTNNFVIHDVRPSRSPGSD